MTAKIDLSIILPMYNEEKAIPQTLRRLLALFDGPLRETTYEIIVVDDGSSDNSAAAVRQVGDPAIQLVQHPYNIGNGATVKTGIRHACGQVLVMMDADGQHPPEDVPRLLAHIGRFDMVVGARTKESDSDWHRDWANSAYNWLATYVTGYAIKDLTSGFRAIKGEIAREFVYLLPNTFSYPTTITMAVLRSGYSLKYVPIVSPRRVGKSKIKLFRDGARFLMIIFKIATLFSPLKVFIPVSVFTFLLGLFYGAFKVIFLGSRYGPTSANLMITAVIIFMIGLISEQITYLRYARR